MKIVNMHEAKTTLSQLVEQVESGEDIVLARTGTPVARIVPFQRSARRTLGPWKGRVRMSDDSHAPLPESELAAWLGEQS